jgi:dolichol-phosphate mannosyltransferase
LPETRPSVAVAIPAYNEAEGIGEFLSELDRELGPASSSLTLVVVDDASKDGTAGRVEALRRELKARLVVHRSDRNRGHGPTTIRAYQLALETGADVILQVDGDGQFDGSDARVLVEALAEGQVAAGVRTGRTDPWFRKVLAFSLRTYLRSVFRVKTRDANCPLRAYRRAALEHMLAQLPKDPLVPNVYLSALADACRYRVVNRPVRHRCRRGSVAEGSTWGKRRISFLVPRRLLVFVFHAFEESKEFRPTVREMRHGAGGWAPSPLGDIVSGLAGHD